MRDDASFWSRAESAELAAQYDIDYGNLGEPMTRAEMVEALHRLRRLGDRPHTKDTP